MEVQIAVKREHAIELWHGTYWDSSRAGTEEDRLPNTGQLSSGHRVVKKTKNGVHVTMARSLESS